MRVSGMPRVSVCLSIGDAISGERGRGMNQELVDYLREMITPGEAQGLPDAVFVYATKGYDW